MYALDVGYAVEDYTCNMRNPELDSYFDKVAVEWQQRLLAALRETIISCGLQETKKWDGPVYVHRGNVVSIGAFKHHACLWFYEGVHLSNFANVLVAANEKTKALRQWRFEETDKVDLELVRQYVMEARENDERGVRTVATRSDVVVIPQELDSMLAENAEARAAFERMPLSHRKEYAGHVAEAKREETRLRRAEKCLAMILKGEGLHDRYR